jgi:hypothetical protein
LSTVRLPPRICKRLFLSSKECPSGTKSIQVVLHRHKAAHIALRAIAQGRFSWVPSTIASLFAQPFIHIPSSVTIRCTCDGRGCDRRYLIVRSQLSDTPEISTACRPPSFAALLAKGLHTLLQPMLLEVKMTTCIDNLAQLPLLFCRHYPNSEHLRLKTKSRPWPLAHQKKRFTKMKTLCVWQWKKRRTLPRSVYRQSGITRRLRACTGGTCTAAEIFSRSDEIGLQVDLRTSGSDSGSERL